MKHIATLLLLCATSFGQILYVDKLYVGGAVAPPTPPVSTDYLLWWKCNDGANSTITATYGPNGSFNGSWVTGQSGNDWAIYTDGSSMWGSTVSSVAYATNKITFCAWIKPLDSGSAVREIAVSRGYVSDNHTWAVYMTEAGALEAAVYAGGFRAEKVAIPFEEWMHIAVVLDNSTTAGDVKIYTNGVAATTESVLDTKASANNFATTIIDVGSIAGTGYWGRYSIDDIRIAPGELTESAIIAIRDDSQ